MGDYRDMSFNYYLDHCEDDPGGEKAYRGASGWWFEAGQDGWVTRQIVVYANGDLEISSLEDPDYLCEVPLEPSEWKRFEVCKDAFELAWQLFSSKGTELGNAMYTASVALSREVASP